jgi:hypothetical protein
MFPDATDQVIRNANVQRAIAPVRHDVDPPAHPKIIDMPGEQDVDGRDGPGHDDRASSARNGLSPE